MSLCERPYPTFNDYARDGGGTGLERALGLDSETVIEEVARSGLRGRGGAAFPTGVKWRSVWEAGAELFVCNAAEGEPATFKDRYLIRQNPYQVLEGTAIAAHAVGASKAVVGFKDVFTTEIDRTREAIEEMRAGGALGGVDIEIAEGPDHFLTGEETGLLQVIEGREPLPTGVPAFVRGAEREPPPAPVGVNNVETLANVPHILAEGADWLRSTGTQDSPGTVVVTLACDVEREGCYEVPIGTPFSEVLDMAGGVRDGHDLQVVVPGASHRVLTPERVDTPLDHASMQEAGSALGAAGFAVFDETADIVEVARLYARFLHVESCGQCPPCKEASEAMLSQLDAFVAGDVTGKAAADGVLAESGRVANGRKCELPTGTRHVMESFIRLFPDAFSGTHAPRSDREVTLPKIVDHDPELGRFVYDTSYALKRSDWSYAG